jgi:hypothetical protein
MAKPGGKRSQVKTKLDAKESEQTAQALDKLKQAALSAIDRRTLVEMLGNRRRQSATGRTRLEPMDVTGHFKTSQPGSNQNRPL